MSQFNLEPWPWNPALCPADKQFIDWLIERKKTLHGPVFHMGTGAHHRVGRSCDALGIECFGITASEEEQFLAPELHGYRSILEDIYEYDPKHLTFHIMSLFHLGEMVDRFGEIQYEKIAALVSRVEPDGKVLLYKRSSAYERAYMQFAVPALESELLKFGGSYMDLDIYTRPS